MRGTRINIQAEIHLLESSRVEIPTTPTGGVGYSLVGKTPEEDARDYRIRSMGRRGLCVTHCRSLNKILNSI